MAKTRKNYIICLSAFSLHPKLNKYIVQTHKQYRNGLVVQLQSRSNSDIYFKPPKFYPTAHLFARTEGQERTLYPMTKKKKKSGFFF